MSDLEPVFYDLNPSDFTNTEPDFSCFEHCKNVHSENLTLNSQSWHNLNETSLRENCLVIFRAMSSKDQCNIPGIITIAEFLKYSCPAGDQYITLNREIKNFANEMHRHTHPIVEIAQNVSGCKLKKSK